MFDQYKDFFDLVMFGTLLSLVAAILIHGLMNGHFKGPLIADDPYEEGNVVDLDQYKNNLQCIDLDERKINLSDDTKHDITVFNEKFDVLNTDSKEKQNLFNIIRDR